MKKITLFLCLLFFVAIEAQTIAWFSDLEDLTGWGINDLDGDGNNWSFYSAGAESFGFTGAFALSASWDSEPAPDGTVLTPDNLLFTPTFAIPVDALVISFKMKVASADATFFAEKYAIYVYDNAVGPSLDTTIYEETLTSGGAGTAKDITASIPASFAGKTIGILVRHYDCTNQFQIIIDDFEVSYSTSLSVKDNTLEIARVYPNPVKSMVTIDTKTNIDSATIINQLGQTIMLIRSKNIINNNIDLSTLRKGMYFMSLKSEGKSSTVKIIKD